MTHLRDWNLPNGDRIHGSLIFGNVIHFSRLWLWVDFLSILNLHLCSFIGFFKWMFFSSIKEINRLISKGMSNIYLKVTIEKNWHFQNFDFLNLKNSSPGKFLGSYNSRSYDWILKLLAATLKSRVLGAKVCVTFLSFWFWKEIGRFKVKESILFVEQKYKL